MKNILIAILAIGLVVSLYFNWKRSGTPSVENTQQMALAKDSFNLTLFFENGTDTTGERTRGGRSETLDTVMFKVSTSVDKSGNIEWETCCPTPPIDTSAVFPKKRFYLIPKVKIYKSPSN